MSTFRARIRHFLPPPILLALFLLFDVFASWPTITELPHRLFALSLTTSFATATGVLSLCLVIAGLLQLILHNTTINALHPDKTNVLLTGGCYRFSRNPVYLGFVGIQFSVALFLGSVVGLLVTPLLVVLITLLHIQFEEAGMARLFGEQWENYRRKTGRWLLHH